MTAELAAHRTAAAAVLADYLREADGARTADLALWAVRMASMLAHLLAVLSDSDQAALELAEVREILAAFDWETGDRQYALEAVDAIVSRGPVTARGAGEMSRAAGSKVSTGVTGRDTYP